MIVLIAVDGTEATTRTLDLACSLFAGNSVDLTLLYVIPAHLAIGSGGPVPVECYDLDRERTNAETLIDRCEAYLKAGGLDAEARSEIALGDPADVILSISSDRATDLIMLGCRGRGLFKRTLLGSVSTKVMTHAECAVLVSQPRAEKAA